MRYRLGRLDLHLASWTQTYLRYANIAGKNMHSTLDPLERLQAKRLDFQGVSNRAGGASKRIVHRREI